MKRIATQTFVFLLLTSLFMTILGTGCEKDEYSPDSIIGKWKWVYSIGGVVGTTYPEEGKKVIWEFSKDSTLVVTENGKTVFESNFHISGDTLKYFRITDIETKVKMTFLSDKLSLDDGDFIGYLKHIN
jgi:hypothetical protein